MITFKKALSTLNKPIVWTYRTVGLICLWLVLASVCAYAARLCYYAVSRSYIVPIVLSNSDAEALDLTQKIVVSSETRDNLLLDIGKLKASVLEMERHKSSLQALEPSLERAIARETDSDINNQPALARLDSKKVQDNKKTATVMQDVAHTEATIEKDLQAGLMTDSDAAIARATLNQMSSAATDSEIAEVLLRDDVLAKNARDTKKLDVLDKLAELQSEISQLDIALIVARRQIDVETRQVKVLNDALKAASQTPYSGIGEKAVVAFVPYKSADGLKEGDAVIACDLDFVWCHTTGKVLRVFTTEEQRTDPIFKLTIRGVMAEISANSEDAKNDTLFLRSKPCGI